MKQGQASSTTYVPKRDPIATAVSVPAVSDIGNAVGGFYGYTGRPPLFGPVISQPGGPPDMVLPKGTQKG